MGLVPFELLLALFHLLISELEMHVQQLGISFQIQRLERERNLKKKSIAFCE
jgi:hypothetical protein